MGWWLRNGRQASEVFKSSEQKLRESGGARAASSHYRNSASDKCPATRKEELLTSS